MKKNTRADMILIGFAVMVGLSEVAHLAAVVLGWTFTRCAYLFVAVTTVLVIALAALYGYLKYKGKNHELYLQSREGGDRVDKFARMQNENTPVKHLLGIAFLLVVLTHVIFIATGAGIYRQSDMVVEVVNSFIDENAVYTVNPMTGQPYTSGIPMRLKVLCLPSLYGFLRVVTGVSTAILVRRVVPVAILLLTYVSYSLLAQVFFPKDDRKRVGFMLMVALLLWLGAYTYGMDGFGLLCCGWTGVTIRNTVLIPWLFSLVIRKKWFCIVLCILTEACISWTLYGAGVGVLTLLGLCLANWLSKRFGNILNGNGTGKEEARGWSF